MYSIKINIEVLNKIEEKIKSSLFLHYKNKIYDVIDLCEEIKKDLSYNPSGLPILVNDIHFYPFIINYVLLFYIEANTVFIFDIKERLDLIDIK